jgi:phage terminase large subunit GpA-like protein
MEYKDQIFELIDSSLHLLSNQMPSEWAEQNRFMTNDVSPFPGRFSFDRTPYLREVVDTLSPNHPARIVATKKGAQIGFSTGVIENGIGYIISQNPGNILFLTGHSDLAEEAMSGKIDQMIDSCGLREMIKPNVLRKRNQRTGDTNKSKEFPGGSLTAGSAGNHKLLRQRSVRFGFIDDFDAARKSTKESGATTEMIEQRFAAYSGKMKLHYISTPEVKQTSNIEPVYELGDQRKYHVPCPCCGDYIVLEWSLTIEKETYGITFERDENGELVDGSVGYTCQSCGDFFTDKHKYEMNLAGEWRPTAKPSEVGYYSYHISSLYAPPGMYDWEHYVRQYIKANPINEPVKMKEMQTFVNLVLGETYEELGEAPKANQLQKNTRDYQVGELPEAMSLRDGNGSIVLLTCGSDLNGKVEDARLDYEITAWTESGASYSIDHGSIGTFIPRESQKKNKVDRVHWTYEENMPNSVWPEFEKVIDRIFETDSGRRMKIMLTGVDTGHYTQFAYSFIEKQKGQRFVIGLKGKDADKYRRFGMDTPTFRPAKERGDLYLVEVNQIKDDLAEQMKLKWFSTKEEPQPSGFMNFPIPSGGRYTYKDFFSHFEAEHRVVDKNADGNGISARWIKKSSAAQNHLWDCRVYNIALKDIMTSLICKELKLKSFTWKDYVDIMMGRY